MIDVLYEDYDIIAAVKPVGVSSQVSENDNMLAILKNQLNLKELPYAVHRLDTAVGGVIIYAKNKTTASQLSKLVSEQKMKKEYLCVVHNLPENEKGRFDDLLFKDSKRNKSFVVNRMRKGVKRAILNYEVLESISFKEQTLSLIKVNLVTGRSHQIRVQFSSRKMPLYGDGKYGGSDNCDIALFSSKIEFDYKNIHHIFSALPNGGIWEKFSIRA